jgi:hypothetical protein
MGRGFGRALFRRVGEQAKALGLAAFEIEADPNAEAFYLHMGAKRVGTRVSKIEGARRELPLLIYRIE